MVMNMNRSDTKITAACPAGHRIRGGVSLAGKSVRCPNCGVVFVFALLKPFHKPVNRDPPSVTDTGVLRILGDRSGGSAMRANKEPAKISCGRCGGVISGDAIVCRHCDSYVGAMPHFMQQMLNCESVSLRKEQ